MPTTRSTLLRRTVGLTAVPLLVFTAGACGDDDEAGGGDAGAFCEKVRELDAAVADAGSSDTAAVDDARSSYDELDPPAEIAEDWDTMVESFSEATELSAEELENLDEDAFAEAEAASERIATYMERECGIED